MGVVCPYITKSKLPHHDLHDDSWWEAIPTSIPCFPMLTIQHHVAPWHWRIKPTVHLQWYNKCAQNHVVFEQSPIPDLISSSSLWDSVFMIVSVFEYWHFVKSLFFMRFCGCLIQGNENHVTHCVYRGNREQWFWKFNNFEGFSLFKKCC